MTPKPLRAVLIATLLACSCSTRSSLPRTFEKLWDDYREMPDQRALALAGDPEDVWVAGASGGHTSPQDARDAAMGECERRRVVRRVVATCRVYAVGERKLLAD